MRHADCPGGLHASNDGRSGPKYEQTAVPCEDLLPRPSAAGGTFVAFYLLSVAASCLESIVE